MENMVGQYQMVQNPSPFQSVSSVPLPAPVKPADEAPGASTAPPAVVTTPAPAFVSSPAQTVNNPVKATQVPSTNPGTIQVPNYSGVNIQIFNPSVTAPGATASPSTVNAPNYCPNPPSCYPPNYYTQNFNQSSTMQPQQPVQTPGTKMEKRDVILLTDDYIKTLENHLNSQKKDERLMGAKEVLARFQEDPTRKNDMALNELVNKMLQDPYKPVQYIAMGLLDTRAATGNATSVNILHGIEQNSSSEDPQTALNAVKAKNILLKMEGNTEEREFEVKEKPKVKSKSKDEEE